MTYKIMRMYYRRTGFARTIKTGLTLRQVQAHCKNPEMSSSTCTNATGKRRTKEHGEWFDCWTEDK